MRGYGGLIVRLTEMELRWSYPRHADAYFQVGS